MYITLMYTNMFQVMQLVNDLWERGLLITSKNITKMSN